MPVKAGIQSNPHGLAALDSRLRGCEEIVCSRDVSESKRNPNGIAYPPVNVFRKGHDFVVIMETPGLNKADLDIQVKDNALHIAGTKSFAYGEKAGLHRRERSAGRFNRAFTIPVQIDADRVRAEYKDGILALYLPRAEQDKPRSIKIS
jgi:HSP20 family protein